MSIRKYLLWFFAAYLLFLLAALPVGWAYGLVVPEGLPMRLTGLSGTVWSGGAQALESGAFRLGPIRWAVRWRSLLALRAEVDFEFGPGPGSGGGGAGHGSSGSGRLGPVGLTSVRMAPVQADLRLADLAALTPLIPASVPGRVRVELQRFTLTDAPFPVRDAEGVVELRDLGSGPPLGVNLGDFHMAVETPEAGDLRVRISDRDGPLKTALTLRLRGDGVYRLHGTLAARNAADANLNALLRFVGRPGPGGLFQVEENGRLPPLF